MAVKAVNAGMGHFTDESSKFMREVSDKIEALQAKIDKTKDANVAAPYKATQYALSFLNGTAHPSGKSPFEVLREGLACAAYNGDIKSFLLIFDAVNATEITPQGRVNKKVPKLAKLGSAPNPNNHEFLSDAVLSEAFPQAARFADLELMQYVADKISITPEDAIRAVKEITNNYYYFHTSKANDAKLELGAVKFIVNLKVERGGSLVPLLSMAQLHSLPSSSFESEDSRTYLSYAINSRNPKVTTKQLEELLNEAKREKDPDIVRMVRSAYMLRLGED